MRAPSPFYFRRALRVAAMMRHCRAAYATPRRHAHCAIDAAAMPAADIFRYAIEYGCMMPLSF